MESSLKPLTVDQVRYCAKMMIDLMKFGQGKLCKYVLHWPLLSGSFQGHCETNNADKVNRLRIPAEGIQLVVRAGLDRGIIAF